MQDEIRFRKISPRFDIIIATIEWAICKDPNKFAVVFSQDNIELRLAKTTEFPEAPALNFFFRITSPEECELVAIRESQQYQEEQ